MIAGKSRYLVGPDVEGDRRAEGVLKRLPVNYQMADDSRTVDV
jgi:hypothetical protein